MEPRRAIQLVLWPALSVLAAWVVGLAVLAAATLGDEPARGERATGLRLVLDRAADAGDLALGDLTGSIAVPGALVLALLAWLVTLGMGAQRYFPEGRRLAPAATAVAAVGALTATSAELAGGVLTLGTVVGVAAAWALVAGAAVFYTAGRRWQAGPPRRHEPAVAAHLADLL